MDGVDKTSSVQGNLRSWPAKKTLSFDASAALLAVYANDAERGCANGGFALKCSSVVSKWNVDTNSQTNWKVFSNKNGGSPPDVSNAKWYEKAYTPGSSFVLPRFGQTTYADRARFALPRSWANFQAPS